MDDESLPSEQQIRTIVAHFAHLRATYGNPFAAPALVEPNGTFFPDEFSLEPESIARLLRRMLGYAPLSDDLDVGLTFLEPEGDGGGGGGCGTGGCSTGGLKEVARGGAIETADGYAAVVHVQDVGEPTILTSALARSIGRIVLFEVDEAVDARDEGALSELTAVGAGFGLLLLNGACVYKKGCGGMRRHKATFLDVDELALALALFVRTTEVKPALVRRHVEVTQREAFDRALAWVDGQPSLVRRLIEAPEALADGVFELEAKKGFLARLFTRSASPSPDAAPAPKARARTEDERRRIAEARALVDEALSEG